MPVCAPLKRSALSLLACAGLTVAAASTAQASPELWMWDNNFNKMVYVTLAEDGGSASLQYFTPVFSGATFNGGFLSLTTTPDGGLLLGTRGYSVAPWTQQSQLWYLADPPRTGGATAFGTSGGATATFTYLGDIPAGAYSAFVLEGLHTDCSGTYYGVDSGADITNAIGDRIARFNGDVLSGDFSYTYLGLTGLDIDDLSPSVDADGRATDHPFLALDSGYVYTYDADTGTATYNYAVGKYALHVIDGSEFTDGVTRAYTLWGDGYLYQINARTGAYELYLGRITNIPSAGMTGTPPAACTAVVDSDGDGVGDDDDLCPGYDDAADADSDGVPDGCDLCEGADVSGDTDGDLVCDDTDNCPIDANADQADADGDSVGDACELDTDGDGTIDDDDNCPDDFNADQADNDLDGLGDVCDDDDDDDGVPDPVDNCPLLENADQADADGDGDGDVCDGDDDADGVLDEDDLCPGTSLDVIINEEGCSGSQLVVVECGGPADWSNHGQYVSCVSHVTNEAKEAGLLTGEEKACIVREAAKTK